MTEFNLIKEICRQLDEAIPLEEGLNFIIVNNASQDGPMRWAVGYINDEDGRMTEILKFNSLKEIIDYYLDKSC